MHFDPKDIVVDPKYVISPDLYKNPKSDLREGAIPTRFSHKPAPKSRPTGNWREHAAQKAEHEKVGSQ
jgi:hypothetical protein